MSYFICLYYPFTPCCFYYFLLVSDCTQHTCKCFSKVNAYCIMPIKHLTVKWETETESFCTDEWWWWWWCCSISGKEERMNLTTQWLWDYIKILNHIDLFLSFLEQRDPAIWSSFRIDSECAGNPPKSQPWLKRFTSTTGQFDEKITSQIWAQFEILLTFLQKL